MVPSFGLCSTETPAIGIEPNTLGVPWKMICGSAAVAITSRSSGASSFLRHVSALEIKRFQVRPIAARDQRSVHGECVGMSSLGYTRTF